MLGRLFMSKIGNYGVERPEIWQKFLGRFIDADVTVRYPEDAVESGMVLVVLWNPTKFVWHTKFNTKFDIMSSKGFFLLS